MKYFALYVLSLFTVAFFAFALWRICAPKERPFVVTYKAISQDNAAYYTYQDKQGRETNFFDSAYKYNVGDTIK